MMKVIEANEAGGPEVLVVTQRAIPAPAQDEVLIKVAAAGINGPDIVQRKGLYPPPKGATDLLGLEVSGEICGLGEKNKGWKIGDKVCALTNGGGYAEYCTAIATHCLPIPENVDLVEASSLPVTFFTVWSNVFIEARLQEGELILIHGGAGGIGSTGIQLAKAFGARIFTTISSKGRDGFCTELGADRVINYEKEDFVQVVREEGGGAKVIVDIVGGDYIARNIKACKHDGRIIQLAFAKGSKVNINFMPVILKRLVYTGSTLRSRPNAYKSEVADKLLEKVWPKFKSRQLKTVINKKFPLEKAADAHRYMESRQHFGKIILEI